MDYSSWLVKQDGGEKYLDDGSSSTGTIITIPDYLRSQAVISNDDKGRRCFSVPGTIFTVPDYRVEISNADKGTRLTVPDYRGLEISNADKGGPYLHYERDTFRDDGLTTKESISGCNDLVVSPTVMSGKGEPDSHGSQAVISKELTSNDRKGGPYLHFERNTFRDDGPTTKESISPCNDLTVSPTVIPMSGKGETCQTTDVRSLDAETNTHQDDGSTGGSQEGEARRASMEPLPSDIVQEILSRVPAESVLECKLVCKKWETLIRGSNFANMHLIHQLNYLHGGNDNNNLAPKVESCLLLACRIDDPDVYKTLLYHGGQVSDRISNDEKYIYNQNLKRIYHPPLHDKGSCDHLVGSCNGLVCAFQRHNTILDPIYICNPLTREYVYLPQLIVNKEDIRPYRVLGEEDMFGYTACGFGYVRSTNEYKVIRIHYLDYKDGIVEVYTLGSGCGWRAVCKISYRLSTLGGGRGTYANDAIYWLIDNKVVAFDLAHEEFRLLSFPPCMQNRQSKVRYGLVVLGSHLCFYMDKLRVEIWSLKESRDSNGTWRMEFDIDYEAVVGSRERTFKPILLAHNGEIIFLHAESVLYSYDTKTTVVKMISNEASADYFEDIDAIAHVNTFASLEAMGENSKKYTVRPRRVRTPWDDVIDELDRVALGEEVDTTRFRLK